MTIVLNDVVSNNNTSVMNANFQKIEDSINDDLLKREVEQGEANEMRTSLDLNSNRAVNLLDGVNAQDAATVSQVEGLVEAGPVGITVGVVNTIVAGANVTVDSTDPANPVVGSIVAPVTYNRIISGGVVWTGTGLVYESIGLEYEIGGVTFEITDGTQITLTAADASDDRIDTVFGNDEGEISFITGVPAGVPVKTAVDETFEIELTFALVIALATEPDAPVTRVVYSENLQESGGEFDTATSAPSRISLTSGASPIAGSVGIKTVAPIVQGDTITFTHTTDTSYSDFSYVQLKLKVLADWNSEYIVVRLQKTGTTIASFNINSRVIDETNLTDVQTVTIFKSQFSDPIGTVFDGIQIFHRIKKGSDILYLMDDITIFEDASENDNQQATTVPEVIVESIVAGTNITVDSTDPANPVVTGTGGGGALEKLSTNLVATAGDDFIVVALPTGYEDFDIRLTGKTGPSNTDFLLRISDDGASTFKSGASDYKSSDGNAVSFISLSDGNSIGSARSLLYSGNITIDDAGTGKFVIVGTFFSSTSVGSQTTVIGAGYYQTDVIVTHLRVEFSAGDMDDMKIVLWGRP